MALCHWPCSCYPNYALGQVHDWMNEIYPLFVAAHGVMIVTPVNWYQAPGPLKAMMDRLVCADGGNPIRPRPHGKNAEDAKALDWPLALSAPSAERLFCDGVQATGRHRNIAARPVGLAGDMHLISGRREGRARLIQSAITSLRDEP